MIGYTFIELGYLSQIESKQRVRGVLLSGLGDGCSGRGRLSVTMLIFQVYSRDWHTKRRLI